MSSLWNKLALTTVLVTGYHLCDAQDKRAAPKLAAPVDLYGYTISSLDSSLEQNRPDNVLFSGLFYATDSVKTVFVSKQDQTAIAAKPDLQRTFQDMMTQIAIADKDTTMHRAAYIKVSRYNSERTVIDGSGFAVNKRDTANTSALHNTVHLHHTSKDLFFDNIDLDSFDVVTIRKDIYDKPFDVSLGQARRTSADRPSATPTVGTPAKP